MQTGLRLWEMHPYPRFAVLAPGGGSLLSAYLPAPTVILSEAVVPTGTKGGAAAGGIYTGAAGAHHNPHGRRPCQTLAP